MRSEHVFCCPSAVRSGFEMSCSVIHFLLERQEQVARTASRAFLQMLRPLAPILLPHYLLPSSVGGIEDAMQDQFNDRLSRKRQRFWLSHGRKTPKLLHQAQ